MMSCGELVGSNILLLVGGLAAIACARWTRPSPTETMRWPQAAARAPPHDRRGAVRSYVSARSHARLRAVAAQLWIDYRLERYDAVIEKAQQSPDEAAPHFWAGLAFYAKSRGDGKPEEQFAWLTRAEDELRRAVEAAPDDWDTKYDYELVTRLASALRKQPKVPPNQLMQLLRPQPRATVRPGRHVG